MALKIRYPDRTPNALQFSKVITLENALDRATVMGKRDYAILRLLWDKALRRFEVAGVSIGDYRERKLCKDQTTIDVFKRS